MITALALFAGIVASWIAYNAGYERGREHELNKAAQRTERMKRFSEHQTLDK